MLNMIEKRDNKKTLQKEEEKAVLIGVFIKNSSNDEQAYMDELEFLAKTAGAVTVKIFTQKLDQPDSKYFVGTGKIEEIKNYIENHTDIGMAIFDDDLQANKLLCLRNIWVLKLLTAAR